MTLDSLLRTFVVLTSTLAVAGERTVQRVTLLEKDRQIYAEHESAFRGTISAAGRFVVFVAADAFDECDTRGLKDCMRRDIHGRSTTLSSVTPDGCAGNDLSYEPAISLDGGLVAFCTFADDLHDDIEGNGIEVLVRDHGTGESRIVSRFPDGKSSRSINTEPQFSGDGRFIAFRSRARLVDEDSNNFSDIYVYDVQSETVTLVSINADGEPGNGDSIIPHVNHDGRFVAFSSYSTNLTHDNDRNNNVDAFLRDRDADQDGVFDEPGEGATERLGYTPSGNVFQVRSSGPTLNADGTLAVFSASDSSRSPYGRLYLRDRVKQETTFIGWGYNGVGINDGVAPYAFSANSRYVLFQTRAWNVVENDTNGQDDVFVLDLETLESVRVNVHDDGSESVNGGAAISMTPSGRYVVFATDDPDFVDDDTNENADTFRIEFLTCNHFLRGDSNCDGSADFDDIDDFVDALIDGDKWAARREHLTCDWECNNDINGDRTVDFNDIDGFVECLVNNGCE